MSELQGELGDRPKTFAMSGAGAEAAQGREMGLRAIALVALEPISGVLRGQFDHALRHGLIACFISPIALIGEGHDVIRRLGGVRKHVSIVAHHSTFAHPMRITARGNYSTWCDGVPTRHRIAFAKQFQIAPSQCSHR